MNSADRAMQICRAAWEARSARLRHGIGSEQYQAALEELDRYTDPATHEEITRGFELADQVEVTE